MSSDPAIDAARRAWNGRYEHPRDHHDDEFDQSTGAWGIAQLAIDAAREALAPLRELHTKMPLYMDCEYGWGGSSERDVCDDGFESIDGEWCCPTCTDEFHGGAEYVCGECCTPDGERTPWPCDTARLIYPEDELRAWTETHDDAQR